MLLVRTVLSLWAAGDEHVATVGGHGVVVDFELLQPLAFRDTRGGGFVLLCVCGWVCVSEYVCGCGCVSE